MLPKSKLLVTSSAVSPDIMGSNLAEITVRPQVYLNISSNILRSNLTLLGLLSKLALPKIGAQLKV